MLDVQANKGLRDSIDDCQGKASIGGNPTILQIKEQTNVTKGTEKVSQCPKFTSTSNNLEDFLLNLAFKWGIKLVSVDGKR